jgi:hypothetical protein
VHDSSKQRQWFLVWLSGDAGEFSDEAVAKIVELQSYADELPAGYCRHHGHHVPLAVSYGAAAQKMLEERRMTRA